LAFAVKSWSTSKSFGFVPNLLEEIKTFAFAKKKFEQIKDFWFCYDP
jgi:hypothetical protein